MALNIFESKKKIIIFTFIFILLIGLFYPLNEHLNNDIQKYKLSNGSYFLYKHTKNQYYDITNNGSYTLFNLKNQKYNPKGYLLKQNIVINHINHNYPTNLYFQIDKKNKNKTINGKLMIESNGYMKWIRIESKQLLQTPNHNMGTVFTLSPIN